jgi:uncharacterized protein (DUF1330 family)
VNSLSAEPQVADCLGQLPEVDVSESVNPHPVTKTETENEVKMDSNLPNPEAVQAMMQSTDPGKVVMLNLLKFKPAGGTDSYAEYVKRVTPILERLGARAIFAGPVTTTVIGGKSWDSMLLVEYPSRKVFLEMVYSPDFREEALERSELHAISPTGQIVPEAKS